MNVVNVPYRYLPGSYPTSTHTHQALTLTRLPTDCARRLKTASVPERYILMCEADHLFMRPMPNMMAGEAQGAALFT